jgi:beta-galactosidase
MEKVPDTTHRPEVAKEFHEEGWKKVDISADTGPLEEDQAAVFRTHFSLTEGDLSAMNALLHFGMIDDDGWVYVNGQLAGESHDWQTDPSFGVRSLLNAGENTLAVVVQNGAGEGGVNKGVTLDLEQMPVAAHWRRSAFNGLAQVIVQTTHQPGRITLTATAPGLRKGVLTITGQ